MPADGSKKVAAKKDGSQTSETAVVSQNKTSTKRSADTSVKKASKKRLKEKKNASKKNDGNAGSIEGDVAEDEEDDVEAVALTSAENQVSLSIITYSCKLLHFAVNYFIPQY